MIPKGKSYTITSPHQTQLDATESNFNHIKYAQMNLKRCHKTDHKMPLEELKRTLIITYLMHK